MRLADKVAIITGGGSGIGLATAKRFVQEGARVAIVGRTAARLEAALRQIEGEAMAVLADVSKALDAERVVRSVLDRWGRIDILVNNAGMLHRPVRVHELTEAEWDRVIENNLKGYFLMARAVLPGMVERRSGAIIMVTSETVQSVTLFVGAYGASKGGVNALTKAIAAEYGEFGVRCNAVQVGATPETLVSLPLREAGVDLTPLARSRLKPIPLGRSGRPEDHANAIAYLASDEAGWVTGAILNVDGGYTAI